MGTHLPRPARAGVGVAVAAALLPIAVLAAGPASADVRTFTSAAVTSDGAGYLITSDRGENYAFGTMTPAANPQGFTGRIARVATTADGRGALAVSTAGQFYASGSATPQRNPAGFSGEISSVALTADGAARWP